MEIWEKGSTNVCFSNPRAKSWLTLSPTPPWGPTEPGSPRCPRFPSSPWGPITPWEPGGPWNVVINEKTDEVNKNMSGGSALFWYVNILRCIVQDLNLVMTKRKLTGSPLGPASPLNPGTPTSPCKGKEMYVHERSVWLVSNKFGQMTRN